uniref:Uncharacterized protein n=1 Tax=Ditylenchus dipsaci TaxID=166011 RepID=A0A915DLR4_9BILA
MALLELAPSDPDSPNLTHYLPHQPVVRHDKGASANSPQDALAKCVESKILFQEAGMNLREFASILRHPLSNLIQMTINSLLFVQNQLSKSIPDLSSELTVHSDSSTVINWLRSKSATKVYHFWSTFKRDYLPALRERQLKLNNFSTK